MAVPTTYATLQTEVALWADHADVTTNVTTFIGYAENRLNRELFGPEREATTTLSASAETVALPSDFYAIRTCECTTAPRRTLQPMTLSELRDNYPATSTGRPTDYAIVGTNMYLGPIPNGSYSIILNYYQTIPPLASNSANWLLTSHPDLYLAAALTEAFLFMRAEEKAALWDSRTMAKVKELNDLGNRKRFGATPMARRGLVASVNNIRA